MCYSFAGCDVKADGLKLPEAMALDFAEGKQYKPLNIRNRILTEL
jgi:hypothetical protein